MSNLTYQATWLKEPRTAVEILKSAVARTDNPATRCLLHLRLARAQAALGEPHACHRSLAAAEWELARTSGGAPAWCAPGWHPPDPHQLSDGSTATCVSVCG